MAREIEKITTHSVDALSRLLEQYKNKPRMTGVESGMNEQFQDMENIVYELSFKRALVNAEGEQLDKIGTIVNLQREPGQSDARYKTLLYVKIGQNTSQGTASKLITILKLLAEADIVFYQNLYDAAVLLAADRDLDPNNDKEDVIFLYDNLQKVAAGGVSIDYLVSFSPDEDAFAFAGNNVDAAALGFGNTLDPSDGGKFARVNRRLVPFAFDGPSVDKEGFGTVRAPLVGGTFVST